MTDKKLPAGTPKGSPAGMIDKFLKDAKSVAPVKEGDTRARLVFALDATMSRQPTWDLACNAPEPNCSRRPRKSAAFPCSSSISAASTSAAPRPGSASRGAYRA